MLNKELISAGFSEKEASVYLAILELGEGNIAQIAKKSHVKRATVYLEIESLKNKGFVSLVKRKKRSIYMAESPKRIEERLTETKESINRLMPELLSIANIMDHKPKVRYFEGVEGRKEIYQDTLKFPGMEIIAWHSDNEWGEYFDSSFILDYYRKKRIEKKIFLRKFAIDCKFMRESQLNDKTELRQIKLIKAGAFSFPADINLYGKNKIAIFSHRENFGMIIESQKIFETLKNIFEIMWLGSASQV